MVANLKRVGVYNCNCLVVLNEDVRLIILKMPLSDIRRMIFSKVNVPNISNSGRLARSWTFHLANIFYFQHLKGILFGDKETLVYDDYRNR